MSAILEDSVRIESVGASSSGLLAALHAASFCKSGDESWSRRSFSNVLSMPGSFCLLASDSLHSARQPCGFAACRNAGLDGELLSIGVVPRYRRSGVARTLLAESLAIFQVQGAERVYLEVAEDNPTAKALYLSAGFTQTGCRRDYYRRLREQKVDALTLCYSFD